MKGKTPHIVQYQGSKRLLASQILEYMPKRFNRLVEPFAGMAAVTIAVATAHRAAEYVLNDINEPIVRLLENVVTNPGQLIDDYAKIWQQQFEFPEGSVAHYYKVRDDFNKGDKCAANMLYLLARCVKGAVRYGSNGLFNQSPDKRRNGTSPKTLEANLYQISFCLNGHTQFRSQDYREVLENTQVGDIVYMDPPYQGVCNTRDKRYFSGIDYNEFVEAVYTLNSRGIDFLISYDGKCGDRHYGNDLPPELGLEKMMLKAGLSSQGLLLGRKDVTYEALYISKGLKQYIPHEKPMYPLFENCMI